MNRRQQRQNRALQRLAETTGVIISQHASIRAKELGFSADDLYRCVNQPEQTYVCPANYWPDRRMYQRGSISLVLHEISRTVITVLLRTGDAWQHGKDTRRTVSIAGERSAGSMAAA